VVAANSLIGAGPVTWLLMHLDGESVTGCSGTVSSCGVGTVHVAGEILKDDVRYGWS
jgi:hypothetical protein